MRKIMFGKKLSLTTDVRLNQIFIKNKGERVSNKFYLLAYKIIIGIKSLTNLKYRRIFDGKVL